LATPLNFETGTPLKGCQGQFVDLLAASGVKSVKLPPRSPNLNAYAERFVRSIKESCLERMIFFGERSLRKAIQEFTRVRAAYNS
jgi:hypothetical protein